MNYGYPQHWADAIAALGYTTFKFAELPEELKDKKMLMRAKVQGYVRPVGKYEPRNGNRNVWKVTR